jgi:hypothetical protein
MMQISVIISKKKPSKHACLACFGKPVTAMEFQEWKQICPRKFAGTKDKFRLG